jgi:hypothetical protein
MRTIEECGNLEKVVLGLIRRCRQETRKPETVRALPEYNSIEKSKTLAQGGLPCTDRERGADMWGLLPSTRP